MPRFGKIFLLYRSCRITYFTKVFSYSYFSTYKNELRSKLFCSLCSSKLISSSKTSQCVTHRFLFATKNSFREMSNEDNDPLQSSPEFDEMTKRIYKHPGMGENILLIQPRVKHGRDWERKEMSEIKMSEAVALVNTLPGWKVLLQHVVSVPSLNAKYIFGQGNLEKIRYIIQANPAITSVFIGIDILSSLQMTTLEQYFCLRVYDRYQVILQIFHDHAHTKEAKLQLALAEIPYLRVKLCGYGHTRDLSTFSGIQHVGGDGETYMEMRRRILNERELKLKKAIGKIKKQRQFLREKNSRSSIPIVAVVGYTNCGKTTLIKSLTNDSALLPQDKLFATLDVTFHAGFLPSKQKVLFIDTVGFISDVPTALIQSFRSTLEEITLADLVIHIRDISHPNTEIQKKTVLKTLEELDLPEKLLNSVVEVGNKVDLLDEPPPESENSDLHLISATDGTGLPEMLEIVENKLFENTGHNITLLRVPNGGEEYSWLLKEAAVRDSIADPKNANNLIIEVVISSVNLAKFKHIFGDLTVSVESLSENFQ
ncbi:putative GTP-binding protein 6 [Uloborus diversus]|uniref:putative GTP-binding protein 6 n=1 Tax=Uloborus diversus TaxID=327109 RepID=UPI0024093C44|nr:putative GTP-binding protein 6 [Uloborus diversus]